MPIVDIDKLEREVLAKKEEQSAIITKQVGNKTLFKGRYLDEWYDNFDECLQANQTYHRIQTNKGLNLNEHGQTPEQVSHMERRKVLASQFAEMQEKMLKMQAEMQNFDSKSVEQASDKKKKAK